MHIINENTAGFAAMQAQTTADAASARTTKGSAGLFFGPRDAARAMQPARQRSYMTVQRGTELEVLTEFAVVNQHDTKQMQALLQRAPWGEIVYGGALTDSPAPLVSKEFTAVCKEIVDAELDVPLTVITRGVYARGHGCAVSGDSTASVGRALWAVVREAREEYPNLRISCVDLGQGASLAELASVPKPDLGDYACYHGYWTTPKMTEINVVKMPSTARRIASGAKNGGFFWSQGAEIFSNPAARRDAAAYGSPPYLSRQRHKHDADSEAGAGGESSTREPGKVKLSLGRDMKLTMRQLIA